MKVPEKTTFDVETNRFVKLFCCFFVKLIFPRNFTPFCSVPSFGIGSSAELGMARNECFLPRNNGNRFESIPRNFFGTKFRSQPLSAAVYGREGCFSTTCSLDWGWQFPTKKLFRGRRNRRNKWLIPTEFRLFRGTENSRNSFPDHSEEDKNVRNSIPLNRNKSKPSKICSEAFAEEKTD